MTESDRRQLFNELYTQHDRPVFAYCLYVVGDRDQAKDVFQEVFVKVYKALHTLKEIDKAPNWIFRIARNECINAMKITQRSDKRSIRIDNEYDVLPAREDRTAYTDEHEHLHRALSQLPTEQREALLLAEFEGFSLKEISDMTGASLANVKVRIHRAKQKLHKILEPILHDHE
jgi:RNA polymerase sigma-70 factor, ECF subfamily